MLRKLRNPLQSTVVLNDITVYIEFYGTPFDQLLIIFQHQGLIRKHGRQLHKR